jgi:hypothetical protein
VRNSHDALGDRLKTQIREDVRRSRLPDWSSVRSPSVVLALHLPQDIETSAALVAVRENVSVSNRQLFENVLAGNEGSFSWLQYAARHVGFVLIPDAPKGSKSELRSWP